MSVLSRPEFHDEAKAFEHLERIIWNGAPVCPHCGSLDRITKVKANPSKRIRMGLWRCGHCKGQFTVKIGTVFEHLRIPLTKALQAVYLMTSSKKGISSHQLHRILEITYKTAWFLSHRIREAMRTGDLAPFGGEGGVVEVDETFIGTKKGTIKKSAFHHKMAVLTLVHRESGAARSFVVDKVTANEVVPIVLQNVQRETYVMTDDAGVYRGGLFRKVFLGHGRVNHNQGEYARGPVFTNTVEGFFSIFKRGFKGVYQHCGEKHLHRYMAEYDFRYSNRAANGFDDGARSLEALKGIVGKRLTYRSAYEQAA
jgi:transposase-like protein